MNVPYEITLLSNAEEAEKELVGFDSPMKLHYSQTSNFKFKSKFK